jgi:8-oxo-dGTP pyrophosphatase MutT (NUDIX family)
MPEPLWPRRGASIADDRLESLASLAEIDHQEARKRVDAALRAIRPLDATEADHRADALAWVRSHAPIWRTAKPATPPKHLVAYFVLVDGGARSCLLVDHRLAELWLPTGGHVEPGEDPAATVARECREEVGFATPLLGGLSSQPLFVTQRVTGGLDPGHVDVSLWYVCAATCRRPVKFDPREFRAARWSPLDELAAADAPGFDPNLSRFVVKLLGEI